MGKIQFKLKVKFNFADSLPVLDHFNVAIIYNVYLSSVIKSGVLLMSTSCICAPETISKNFRRFSHHIPNGLDRDKVYAILLVWIDGYSLETGKVPI